MTYIEIERTYEDLSRDYESATVLLRFEIPDFHRATLTCPGSEGPILDRITYLDGSPFDGEIDSYDIARATRQVVELIDDELEYARAH